MLLQYSATTNGSREMALFIQSKEFDIGRAVFIHVTEKISLSLSLSLSLSCIHIHTYTYLELQLSVCVPDHFRRRDSSQQGTAAFQYDDVSICLDIIFTMCFAHLLAFFLTTRD